MRLENYKWNVILSKYFVGALKKSIESLDVPYRKAQPRSQHIFSSKRKKKKVLADF